MGDAGFDARRGERREDLVETGDLHRRGLGVLGGGEMGPGPDVDDTEVPCQGGGGEQGIVGQDPSPGHPGVDLEMDS